MQLLKHFKIQLKKIKSNLLIFLKWSSLAIVVGGVCGVVGTGFAKSIDLVTDFRENHNWLYFLLPLGGIVIVGLYKLLKVEYLGTNDVFESTQTDKKVPILLAPAIFISSAITHLLGGSAGREGAALQLGGSISSFIARGLKLKEDNRRIITTCGMGALFSALFGTPLTAFIFAIEIVQIGSFCSSAIFPALISSITAHKISTLLGVHPERFLVLNIPKFNLLVILKVLSIAILGAVISIVFCNVMYLSKFAFKKHFKNPYIRILIGGGIIIILTLLVGNFDYNGGGMNIINRVFESGEVRPPAFAFKIIFTAITIGSGFKGGEIIPTIFIGATFGGAFGNLIGLSTDLSAAVGVSALFCGVTNCPLATLFLAFELFGANGIIYYAITVAISFVLSGKCSLYSKQKFLFNKLV